MRSLNMLNSALIFTVMSIFSQSASAQDAMHEMVTKVQNTVSAVHDMPASMQSTHDSDRFEISDTLLAMIAGGVLVILQLRRHQKVQSDTRIINPNTLLRFNASLRHHAEKAEIASAAESELIAHAERG